MKKLLLLVIILFVSGCVQTTTPEIISINPCEDPNSYTCFVEPPL